MIVDVRQPIIRTPQLSTIPVIGPEGPVGPQGPEGPEGPAGNAGGSSIVQPFTNTNFVSVLHSFGRKPNIVVATSDGVDISDGVDKSYPSNTQVVVSWNTMLTGEVVLS